MNKKILLEAVVAQEKKVTHLRAILKEALSHPVFKSFKQFENELEYQLFESVAFGAGRAPAGGSIAIGTGGSGRFGKHTEALGKLRSVLASAPSIGMSTSPSELLSSLQRMFAQLDSVVEILKSDTADESTKREARMLVYNINSFLSKSNEQLRTLRNFVIKARRDLNMVEKNEAEMRNELYDHISKLMKVIPRDFSFLKAKGDVEQAEMAGRSADEYERKLKRGFFGGLADKLGWMFGR